YGRRDSLPRPSLRQRKTRPARLPTPGTRAALARNGEEGTSVMTTRHAILAVGVICGLAAALPAMAADYQVQMLTKGPDGEAMVFEPAFLKIAPGDTVTFVATNPAHDSESIPGMLPEGAEGWKGKMSKDVTVTFTQPGLYGYKCAPHYAMGMVGLIEVGDDPV